MDDYYTSVIEDALRIAVERAETMKSALEAIIAGKDNPCHIANQALDNVRKSS